MEIFNTDEAISSSTNRNTFTIQRALFDKIVVLNNRYGFTKIVTNGNIASVLQDVAGYTINPMNAGKQVFTGQIYPMGKIADIDIFVDPYMRWDDNRILFSYGIKTTRKIKINKVFNIKSDEPTHLTLNVVDPQNYLI